MAANPFQRAARAGINLRLALVGPTGSGKTMWGLELAAILAGDTTPAVLDTEHGSAKRYADTVVFDAVELESFAPAVYVDGIRTAQKYGYRSLLIDSLSHAWAGADGALAMVDKAASRGSGNSYAAWRDVTPEHHRLVEAMLAAQLHLVATMRVKTEYVLEPNDRGKMVPRKVGLAPVQRDGLEYEFDIVADVQMDHTLVIGKTRCSALDGGVFRPAEFDDLAEILLAWVGGGALAEPRPAVEEQPAEPAAPAAPALPTPAAAPVADDEFMKDDNDPFDEEPAPAPAGSDPATVKRLAGGFDHTFGEASLRQWTKEYQDALQLGSIISREGGTAKPALDEARRKAELRVEKCRDLAIGFEAAQDIDALTELDFELTAARDQGLLRDGTEAMQAVTMYGLIAMARLTTDETFDELTEAIGDAGTAGNLAPGTDAYTKVMAALAAADERCSKE